VRLTSYSDPSVFLSVVKDTLMRHEAKNNLMLGIASRLENGVSYGEAKPYFLIVDYKGRVLGAAVLCVGGVLGRASCGSDC
jgi:hypothetical protein